VLTTNAWPRKLVEGGQGYHRLHSLDPDRQMEEASQRSLHSSAPPTKKALTKTLIMTDFIRRYDD